MADPLCTHFGTETSLLVIVVLMGAVLYVPPLFIYTYGMTLPKDPEKLAAFIEKQRENNRKQFEDPANRDKQRQKAIEQFSNPSAREAVAQKQRELWADPEYRARMVEAAKNKPPVSEITRKKIGDKHRGMKRPLHTGEAISEAAKKRWASYSEEYRREIMSKVLAGVIPGEQAARWASYTEEQRNAILAPAMKSRKENWEALTDEERAARMATMTAKAADFWRQAYEEKSDVWNARVQAIMLGNLISPNKAETALQEILGIACPGCYKFVGDGSTVIGGKCPDFIYGTKIIEMFGTYWHRGEDPSVKIAHFAKYGFKTLVIWEHELKDPDLMDRVIAFTGVILPT